MKQKIPLSPFVIGLSSSAKETELRIRSIVQWKKKRPPVVFLVLAILAALLCGGLVSCQPNGEEPPADNDLTSSTPVADEETTPADGDRKKDFYTFLVVGQDVSGNTDTILLAAYDIPNQKLNVMSIPRDTMVNIPYDIKRINAVYNYAGGGDAGIQALYTEVSQMVGFMPDFKIVVEWKAVGGLVDAVGGVWFDVPCNMNYDDPTQDLHIHISKGYQLLNGEQAMGVLRWRANSDGTGGYNTGDVGRIETQQAVLKAVIAQCMEIGSLDMIQEFARVFTDNVQTDLTLSNLVWFAGQACFGGLTMENVNFITLPGDESDRFYMPDTEQLLTVVNESFDPYLAGR